MPRVPSLNQPQVAPKEVKLTARPGVRVEDRSSAEAFGAGVGRAVQGLGEAVTGLGNTLSEIQLDRLNRQNESEAREAEQSWIEHERSALHNPQTGYYAKSGGDAVKGREAAAKGLQQKAQEIANGISNPEARRQYFELISPRLNARLIDINQFSARHQAVWETAQYEARRNGAVNDAITGGVVDGKVNALEIRVQSGLALIAVHDQADREGWSQEQRDLEIAETRSAIHTGVIFRLLQQPGGAVKAEKYYEANADEVSNAKLKIEVENALKDGVAQETATARAGEIISAFAANGAKADEWFGAAMAEAERIEDAEMRDRVFGKIVERHRHQKGIEVAAENAAWAEADDFVLNGGNPDDLRWETKDKIGAERFSVLRKAYETAGRRITTPKGFEVIDHFYFGPAEEVAKMDPREFRGELNASDYRTIQALHKAAVDRIGGRLSDFDPRNPEIVKYIGGRFEAYGPRGGYQKGSRGRIVATVASVLGEVAQRKGAGLTFGEQQEIVDRLLIEIKPGDVRSDPTQVIDIDDGDDVPEDDRRRIEQDLRSKKIKPSEDRVIRMYIREKLLADESAP